MPSTHSHSSGRHGDRHSHHHSSHHVARGSVPASRIARLPTSSPHKTAEEPRRRSHRGSSASGSFSSKSKNAATLCVISAFLGLGIDTINEIIAHSAKANTNTFFNILTVSLGAVAVGLGAYAQTAQLRRWSYQTRMRIMIGLPVALLTLAAVTPNFYEKPALGNLLSDRPRAQTAVPATADAPETDNSLVKTGWYGELQYDGLLLIVSAYEENAVESKQFNSRLPKPVSYATLTVINLGNPTPVVLSKLQVGIHLTGGEVVQSLPIKPLLDHNADVNSDLIKRLALPLQLAIGGMLPDIPICMESGFSWSRVSAVTVPLGVQELSVRGRVMTAEEKKTMLEKSKSSRSASDGKGAAETWFKNL